MRSAKEIEYVELERADTSQQPASFFFRRFMQETFRPPASDAPHRHNYQELFIVKAGDGRHAIDNHSIDLLPCTVSMISKGQVHVVEHLTDFTGWLIRFSDDFLPVDAVSQAWNYHTTLFNQFGRDHVLTVEPADLRELEAVLDLIEAEWTQPGAFQQTNALRFLLAALLIRLERIYQNSFGTTQHARDEYRVYQQFMALLEDHAARRHDVQYYATELQLPAVRLSRILGRIVGRTTKQLIDERIVLEARRLLQYTDLPIKEIAGALGYADVFHLSKTFKRVTGVAPQAFREQHQKMT